jgi:hypothetical protein
MKPKSASPVPPAGMVATVGSLNSRAVHITNGLPLHMRHNQRVLKINRIGEIQVQRSQDGLAVDKILRVTAGNPYVLQLTCHALVNHANRGRRGYLTIRDVNEVLGEMVELGEAHFAFLWEQSDTQEQLILTSLTRLQGQEPTVMATQIAEALRERGVIMETRDATGTLERLVDRDIVREVPGQPPRYEYKVELLRIWVERYKALGRLIEEVG